MFPISGQLHRLGSQNFGHGLHDHEIPSWNLLYPGSRGGINPLTGWPQSPAAHQPQWGLLPHFPHRMGSGLSEVKLEKDQFQVKLDVHHFSPDELVVKAVGGFVVVEGNHEEKEDEHGLITRSFARRYLLPSDVKAEDFDDNVACELSTDGVLTITVPRKTKEMLDGPGKPLPIKQTGVPAAASAIKNGH